MKHLWLSAILLAALPAFAQAGRHSGFDFSIGFGYSNYGSHRGGWDGGFGYSRHYYPPPVYYYAPRPVYVAPSPVYVAPPPVYYAPPPVVRYEYYYAPAPVYCPPPPVYYERSNYYYRGGGGYYYGR